MKIHYGRENVQSLKSFSGKCPVRELSDQRSIHWGNVCQGSVSRGSVLQGNVSWGNIQLGLYLTIVPCMLIV